MVNASLINRLSQAVDLIEQRSQQNRPWKIVTVRRGLKEDPDTARDRHFAAHPEDRGANIVIFDFYENEDGRREPSHPPAGPACEEPERPPANDAYEAALAALRDDKQTWWADTLACDPDELGEREEPAGPAPLARRQGAAVVREPEDRIGQR